MHPTDDGWIDRLSAEMLLGSAEAMKAWALSLRATRLHVELTPRVVPYSFGSLCEVGGGATEEEGRGSGGPYGGRV